MPFQVKARVLLELGAELISSDAIALYELIKNAIDAGSPKIEIRIAIALTTSGYQALLDELERLEVSRVPRDLIESNLGRCFEPATPVSMRDTLVEQLGGAPIEVAIKRLREFYVSNSYIEIEDFGHGMSRRDLNEKFLTIGTSHRALERKPAARSDSPILGEKGIGRLSAMRLGRTLDLVTSKANELRRATLSIDWAALGDDLDLDLDGFVVEAQDGDRKPNSREHGTLIRIADLQADWSRNRITEIAKTELSKLQDPFDRKAARLDLRISYNGDKLSVIEQLSTKWLSKWHGYFELTFGYERTDDRLQPTLTGLVKYRVPGKDAIPDEEEIDEKPIHAVGSEAYSLLAEYEQSLVKGGIESTPARFSGIHTLGPFSAKGYWYNRLRKRKELPKESYDDFIQWLTQWGGGLLVYRDGFRVYPYADPDDDWLELDQKALRRKSFKLNRGQFLGHVQISSRTNQRLIDQTNRQGLCDSPEKRRLVQCLQYVIWDELGALVKKYELKTHKNP